MNRKTFTEVPLEDLQFEGIEYLLTESDAHDEDDDPRLKIRVRINGVKYGVIYRIPEADYREAGIADLLRDRIPAFVREVEDRVADPNDDGGYAYYY